MSKIYCKHYLVFFLSLFGGALLAQNHNIGIVQVVTWTEFDFDERVDAEPLDPRYTVRGVSNTLSYSKRMHKAFHLRGELGINRVVRTIDKLRYNSDNQDLDIQSGDLSGEYDKFNYYVGIFPEIRFTKKELFFINAGYQFYFYQESKLVDIRLRGRNGVEFLDKEVSMGGTTNGFSFNVGINPKFKNFGLILSGGYQVVLPSFDPKEILIGTGWNQFTVNYGLSYTFGRSHDS